MSKIQVRDKEIFVDTVKDAGGYNSLALRVGCSQTMLSLIAKGTRNPSPTIAVNICAETGKRFDDIFFIESNDKSN